MNPITIANTTKQHWIFWYRDPVNDKILKRVHINSGAQVTIGGGWSAEQKRKVIEQLERAGARDAAEAHGKLAGRFGGLLYRDIGLVDVGEIHTGHEAVVDAQEKRSVAEAMKGVAGFDRAVNGAKRQRVARVTEVTVKQLPAPGSRLTGDEVEFNMTVDPDGRADVRLPA